MNEHTRAPIESDRALARQVQASGDEGAFLHLYDRYTPALSQFVLRMTDGAIHEAEDVVQETWLRAVFPKRDRSKRWCRINTTLQAGTPNGSCSQLAAQETPARHVTGAIIARGPA